MVRTVQNGKEALTFDDILLVPGASKVLPKDANLETRISKKLKINIPFISAAMDTVTESRTAIAIAREGGIGIIHKNLDAESQASEVNKVKRSEFLIVSNPLCIGPDDSLQKVFELQKTIGIGSFPVTKNNKLVGIVTQRDIAFESNFAKKVSEIMTKDVISINHEPSADEAKEVLHKHRIEKLLLQKTKKEDFLLEQQLVLVILQELKN